MQEKAKEPEIRFAGFTGAWEQRKFSKLVLIERGGSPRPIDNYITNKSNGINWVKIGDAPKEGRYITKTAEKIRPEGVNKSREVFPGDLILSNSMSFGKPYIMGIRGCIHDGWLLIRDTNKIFDPIFLCYLLGTDQMLAQYKALASGSTVNNLNKELVGNTHISLPGKEEQHVIGEFLQGLDSLLTLHQRKYEKLLNIKKSMLEKMFPKEGEVVPEIRFKGFTGAWEQRKLSDIAERITRKNTHLESTLPLTISSSYGLIDQYAYFNNRVASRNTRNYYLIKNGEFAYNKSYSDGFPFGSVKRLDRYAMGVLSTLYIIFSIDYRKVNSDFLVSYYDTKNWHHQVALRAAEGARNHGLLNISADDFFETELKIPMNLDEQKKIGSFFDQLNSFITLHQRKLEMLKNEKQAFLEKMFV